MEQEWAATLKLQKPKPSKSNKRPMVSKNTAPALRAVLAHIDRQESEFDEVTTRGLDYIRRFADYLEGPAYAKKSLRQSLTTKAWRKIRKDSTTAE